jgi:hypothetical protein
MRPTSLFLATLLALSVGACLDAGSGVTTTETPARPMTEPGPKLLEGGVGDEQMVVAIGAEVWLYSVDGSSRVVFDDASFFAGATAVEIHGNDNFFVINSYAHQDGSRHLLMGADGVLRWQQPCSDDRLGIILGDDGIVSWRDRFQSPSVIHTISPDESNSQLTGYLIMGRSSDGYLPVQTEFDADIGNEFVTEYGWWEVGSETFEPTASFQQDAPGLYRVPRVSHGRLLNLDVSELGGIVLIARSPTETLTIAIPGASDAAHIVDADTSQRWVLVATGEANQLARVDLDTVSAEVLGLVAPENNRLFSECARLESIDQLARLTPDGQIHAVFRDDDRAAVFTTAEGHWTQVGGSITAVGGLDVSIHGGTYVINGHESNYCYGASPTWGTSTTSDFTGDVTQFVRPGTGSQVSLKYEYNAPYVHSDSGRYVSYWAWDSISGSYSLEVLDIETGTQTQWVTDSTEMHSSPLWLSAEH